MTSLSSFVGEARSRGGEFIFTADYLFSERYDYFWVKLATGQNYVRRRTFFKLHKKYIYLSKKVSTYLVQTYTPFSNQLQTTCMEFGKNATDFNSSTAESCPNGRRNAEPPKLTALFSNCMHCRLNWPKNVYMHQSLLRWQCHLMLSFTF